MINFHIKEFRDINDVQLSLEQSTSGEVWLMATHKDDYPNRWMLMSLRPDGTFIRWGKLPNRLGFKLDDSGKIAEYTE